jgi:hypothetical protein
LAITSGSTVAFEGATDSGDFAIAASTTVVWAGVWDAEGLLSSEGSSTVAWVGKSVGAGVLEVLTSSNVKFFSPFAAGSYVTVF